MIVSLSRKESGPQSGLNPNLVSMKKKNSDDKVEYGQDRESRQAYQAFLILVGEFQKAGNKVQLKEVGNPCKFARNPCAP